MIHQQYETLSNKTYRECLQRLDSRIIKAINKKLEYLKNDLDHPGLNLKPYVASSNHPILSKLNITKFHEIRLNYHFRAIIAINYEKCIIYLLFVGTHDEVKQFCKRKPSQ